MRSRASGGTCGDSVAAASAATMSSLRRRAICVQRAMSTERSSIGARASARTTAGASPGSASSRSQASTSRTSARWKKAASPITTVRDRALLERDRDRLSFACDLGDDHGDPAGVDLLARDQPLDLGGDRLGLRALVLAAPELDLTVGRQALNRRSRHRPRRGEHGRRTTVR